MRAMRTWMVLVLAACSADDAEPVMDGPLEPAPPEGGQQLATSSWKLQPGEEKYVCFQFYSPDEPVGITRVEQIAAEGIHHFALFQAFGRNEPEEVHECNTLVKQTWLPIWVSGTGAHELTLPAGTGFIIQPGTQYIVQLHLQNQGDEDLVIRGGVNLTYEWDTAALTPAGMYALGNYRVNIPAQSTDYSVSVPDCSPGKQMKVFGMFPHMHKLGTKIDLTRTPVGASAAQPLYKVDPWNFSDAPFDMIDATVVPGEKVHLTCSYANPYDRPVGFGESSDEEMCFFVMFYYPYDFLDGCIIN